jgi:hypothetical protein
MLHQKHKKGEKTYLIYDERARQNGTDEAQVLDTADTEKEALDVVEKLWPNGVIFEYEDDGSGKLTHEKQVN